MKQYLLPVALGFAAGMIVERIYALSEKIPGVNSLPQA